MSAVGKGVKQQQQRREKGEHARHIEFMRAQFVARLFEPDDDQSGCDGGNRQVDEKCPTPMPMFDDDAAGEWSEYRCDSPDAADDALHSGTLLRPKQNAYYY